MSLVSVAKEYIKDEYVQLLLLLLLTDVIIVLNVPLARQVFGYIYFTFVPGLLILHLLKLRDINVFLKAVLSYGLGVSFLMFAGLAITLLRRPVGVPKPLTTLPIVGLLSAVVAGMCVVLFFITPSTSDRWIPWWKLDIRSLTAPSVSKTLTIMVCFFPMLSVIGTYLMNVHGVNVLLVLIPFFLLLYAVLLIFWKDKVSARTYPITLSLIGLSIALLMPLRGQLGLLGGDGSQEYYTIVHTVANGFWTTSMPYTGPEVSACLSVSMLHTVLINLLGITPLLAYRIITPLIVASIPLGLFLLNRTFMRDANAFLIALFFASQAFFIADVFSARVQISMFFLMLSLLVLRSDTSNNKYLRGIRRTGWTARTLLMVFIFSLIVSYYAYSYVFALILLISVPCTLVQSKKLGKTVTFTLILIIIVSEFLWWSQLTAASGGLAFQITQTIQMLTDLTFRSTTDVLVQQATGASVSTIGNTIARYVFEGTVAVAVLGVLALLLDKKQRLTYGVEYFSIMLSCVILWGIMVVFPGFFLGFGVERVYYPTILICAPAVFVGCETIVRLPMVIRTLVKPFRQNYSFKVGRSHNMLGGGYHSLAVLAPIFILLIIITSNMMVGVGVTYQAVGEHHSVLLNDDGTQYDTWYMHPQEYAASSWIKDKGSNSSDINTDAYGANKLTLGLVDSGLTTNNQLFFLNRTVQGYIYLDYPNVVNGYVYTWFTRKDFSSYGPLSDYPNLFADKSLIYDNAGSQVYY